MPERRESKRAILLLGKLTGWPLREMLGMTWQEILEWITDAAELEKEINAHG